MNDNINQDELDKDILEYIETSKKEMDRLFEILKDLNKISSIPPIEPRSSTLWFNGLKKYGKVFADREYKLSKIYKKEIS